MFFLFFYVMILYGQSVIGQNKQLTVSKPSKDFPLPLQLVCEVKHTPAHQRPPHQRLSQQFPEGLHSLTATC